MKTEREATRIIESWLEPGSTALPDRVLDAVLAELPSNPQRRSWWSPWRNPHGNTLLKLGAVAAVVAIAVVAGISFLPGRLGVGGPAGNPSPSLPPGGFGGNVTIPFLESTASIEMLGSVDGATVSGTALFGHRHGNLGLQLQCLRRESDRWIFGGVVESVTTDDPQVGSFAAVLVIDGPQQQAMVWNPEIQPNGPELEPRGSTGSSPQAGPDPLCSALVAGLSPDVFDDTEPVTEGRITLPLTP